MSNDDKKQTTLSVRVSTKAGLKERLAEHIGKTGEVISMAEFMDRRSKMPLI